MLSVVAEAEPIATEAEPITAKPQPITAKPEPITAKPEPIPTAAEPIPKLWESNNLPSLDPTSGGEITSPFGYRTYPYPEFHRGLDLAAPTGRPVLVTANGRIIFAGWQGGFGNKIEVDHGNGYMTWYGHLSKLDVAVGERVARGAVIGEVGATGDATGPHLHYQIMRNGVAIDPLPYLAAGGRTLGNSQGIVSR
jgi:murein DD-endopeptidase MepM/ murein hydrolase activator NlpD